MFQPSFTITNTLLYNIKKINSLIIDLNNRNFPKTVLLEFEKTARTISSYASTSIEGNPLPITEVRKILKSTPPNIQATEKEVLNYNQILESLNKKLKRGSLKLTLNLILTIHKGIMSDLMPSTKLRRFRSDPVFANNPTTGKTTYLPPDSKDIPFLIKELITFINRSKNSIDPLILAGIFHKQFVIIHPFMDGNGRTARLATKVLLAEIGLNTFNLFSFENYYNQNVTNYFRKVGVFGNYYDLEKSVDFTGWLEYFTDGIIDELFRVKKQLSKVISSGPSDEIKPYHQKVLNFIQEKGYVTDLDYSKLTDRAKATRSLDFKKLIDMGLIVRKGKGRATFYTKKTRVCI